MSKTNYAEVAKKLGVKHRIGKYGIEFGFSNLPGMKKKYRSLVRIVPLDGWIFDPHEIIEAIANDDNLSIKYQEKP